MRSLEPVSGVESRALTSLLLKQLKEEIIHVKDESRVLMRFNELRETMQVPLSGEFMQVSVLTSYAFVSVEVSVLTFQNG
ncbi:MAG: hypothetical protein ABSH34_09480 [Verrucomicrobiota bacterium]